MKKILILGLIAASAIAWFSATRPTQDTAKLETTDAQSNIQTSELSPAAKTGETYFNAKCSACHGLNATGTENGPPLIHKIYEPNHHGDESFQRAAAFGVQSHHWPFGNMPPVQGINRAEVAKIIRYIREVQKTHGIY
ncbi:MAG: cytochrome C [Rhodobacteraceae bacterium]|nr:MAG: cytochrome C [Paracoccaceae bacterium]